MKTATKEEYKQRIERGMTKIWVPHGDSEIAFVSPKVGPNTYREVGKQILNNRQEVPTGDYTSSLLHVAYCNESASNEPEFRDVRDVMQKGWLWVFNKILWSGIKGREGVYSLKDEKALGRSESLNINKLEKMLKGGKEINEIRFSKDGKVSFAPRGSYKLNDNTPQEFSENGFIIAVNGIEGAKKLGEVSSTFKSNPHVYGVDVNKGQTKQRVSAVCEIDGWLGFYGGWGGSSDIDGGGCGFGVRR